MQSVTLQEGALERTGGEDENRERGERTKAEHEGEEGLPLNRRVDEVRIMRRQLEGIQRVKRRR